MGKTYVVFRGRIPGIYDCWDGEAQAQQQIHQFSNAYHRSYATKVEAEIHWRQWCQSHPNLEAINQDVTTLPINKYIIVVLQLQMDDGLDEDYLQYLPLTEDLEILRLKDRATFQSVLNTIAPSSAILVLDGGIAEITGKSHAKAIATFAKAGGTVIFGGLFSSLTRPLEANSMFEDCFQLPWNFGDYSRNNYFRNCYVDSALNGQYAGALLEQYNMKAVSLKNVDFDSRLYLPQPLSTDVKQTPVVFAPYGQGYLGYVGDVNNEAGSCSAIQSMLGMRLELDSY